MDSRNRNSEMYPCQISLLKCKLNLSIFTLAEVKLCQMLADSLKIQIPTKTDETSKVWRPRLLAILSSIM